MYEMSGRNILLGLLTPVNESVWEHLKLLFFPFLLYMLGEYIVYGRKLPCFLFDRTTGLLCGLLCIPLIFYGYTLFTRKPVLAVDMMIFFFGTGLSFYISACRLSENRCIKKGQNKTAVLILVCFTVLFAGLTLVCA